MDRLGRKVDLEEQVVSDHPLPPWAQRHAVEHICQHSEGQPVGRYDTQESPLPEPTGIGGGASRKVRGDKRPIQEKS